MSTSRHVKSSHITGLLCVCGELAKYQNTYLQWFCCCCCRWNKLLNIKWNWVLRKDDFEFVTDINLNHIFPHTSGATHPKKNWTFWKWGVKFCKIDTHGVHYIAEVRDLHLNSIHFNKFSTQFSGPNTNSTPGFIGINWSIPDFSCPWIVRKIRGVPLITSAWTKNTLPINCKMKLLIKSQTSTTVRFKIGNG